MSDLKANRKNTRVSDDNTTSISTSKDDENLMQNWSLTFTEYADNNNFVPNQRLPNGNSKTNANDGSENSVFNQTRPDGRGEDVIPNRERGDSRRTNTPKPATKSVSESITLVPSNSQTETSIVQPESRLSVKVSVHATGLNQGNSKDVGQSSVNSKRLENSRSPSFTEPSDGRITATTDTSDKNLQFNERNKISKHTVLPPIGPGSESPNNVKYKRTAPPPDIVRRKMGDPRGRTGPRTTPPPDGYGGKVQQIYVRFPGQRTGQMML